MSSAYSFVQIGNHYLHVIVNLIVKLFVKLHQHVIVNLIVKLFVKLHQHVIVNLIVNLIVNIVYSNS